LGLEHRWVQPDCRVGLQPKDSNNIISLFKC
jgi:hypothetical protein